MVDRSHLSRSPLFRWAGASAAGQAHLSRGLGAARGRRRTNSRGERHGGGAETAAVWGPAVHAALKCSARAARRVGNVLAAGRGRAGYNPSLLLHPGALQPRGCSQRAGRVL